MIKEVIGIFVIGMFLLSIVSSAEISITEFSNRNDVMKKIYFGLSFLIFIFIIIIIGVIIENLRKQRNFTKSLNYKT